MGGGRLETVKGCVDTRVALGASNQALSVLQGRSGCGGTLVICGSPQTQTLMQPGWMAEH